MSGLNDLKVGDILFSPNRNYGGGTFKKVERLTATRAFVTGGDSYRLKDGYRVGDSGYWHRAWVRKATEADFEEEKTLKRIMNARIIFQKINVSSENIDAVEVFLAQLNLDNKG